MRGEVEIWSGDELIHKENNLLVNGAGELLADIMTVSPSLSGIEDHATSSILDSSNYTIQAISFGKDASAYQYNAHAIPERRNLYSYSTFSSTTLDRVTGSFLSSVPEEKNPPGFEDVPSSVAHVVIYGDISSEENQTVTYQLHKNDGGLDLSTGQDLWLCRSTYLKLGVPEYPEYRPVLQYNYHRTHYKTQIEAEGNVYTSDGIGSGLGRARSSTDPRWGDGELSYSSLTWGFTGDNRQENNTVYGGYSIDKWDQGGGVIPVGDGWYRIWTTVLSPVSGVSAMTFTTYPTSHDGQEPLGETSGGVYAFGEQLEVGRFPTKLQFKTDGVLPTAWDFSGSVLNRDHCPGTEIDNGTVRVIPPYGTSSYVPTNYLSSPPNPDSTRVEDRDTAPLDSSSVVSGFNRGQNLNVIPYREQKDQLPGITFYTTENYIDNGQELQVLNDVGANEPSGAYSLGPQAYWLGCYPEGSSTGGSTFALVSSLDNSAAYLGLDDASSSPYYVHGTYNSIVNEASSMDVSGFVNMIMSGSPATTTGYAMSSTASGLCMSGGADIDNSGMVEYSMLLGSGDVGYSNLYGGIYNMGLWTIDMEETLKAGNTPPYSFGPLNNPRKYKLFATKHLTRNLCYINDNGTAAGAMNYQDVTIKWRIHFT